MKLFCIFSRRDLHRLVREANALMDIKRGIQAVRKNFCEKYRDAARSGDVMVVERYSLRFFLLHGRMQI